MIRRNAFPIIFDYDLYLLLIVQNAQHDFIALAMNNIILQLIVDDTGICVCVNVYEILFLGDVNFIFKMTAF